MTSRNRPFPLGTAIPTVYDVSWQSYTNLTPAQIAAFEAFPQDLIKYSALTRSAYEYRLFNQFLPNPPTPYITVGGIQITITDANLIRINGLALDATISPGNAPYNFTIGGVAYSMTAQQALGLFSGVRAYIEQCRGIETTMINGINANPPTITSRAQIDSAFAVLN